MRRLEQEEWWEELVSLKDELSLRELAERFKATPSAISNALRRNRLERRPAQSGPRAYRTIKSDPGFRRVKPVASKLTGEPKVRPGSKDSLLQPAFHLLGKVPDSEIADRCGVSIRTVASYRARHNIAGYAGPRKRQTDAKKMHQSKIDAYASLVGVESDDEIARRAGVTPNAVRHYRVTRGIGATEAVQRAVVAPRPAATQSAATYGWLVRFDNSEGKLERVMTGPGIEVVAQRARGLGLGAVIAVERLGIFVGPEMPSAS